LFEKNKGKSSGAHTVRHNLRHNTGDEVLAVPRNFDRILITYGAYFLIDRFLLPVTAGDSGVWDA